MNWDFNEFIILGAFIGGVFLIYMSSCIMQGLNIDSKFVKIKMFFTGLMGLVGYICFLLSPAVLTIRFIKDNHILLAMGTGIAYLAILSSVIYGVCKTKRK